MDWKDKANLACREFLKLYRPAYFVGNSSSDQTKKIALAQKHVTVIGYGHQ